MNTAPLKANSGPSKTLASLLCVPLVWVTVGRLHDAFAPITGSIPAAKVLIPLCYLSLLMLPLTVLVPQIWRTPQAKGFVLFVAAMFISLPFSYYKGASFKIVTDFISASVPMYLAFVFGIRRLADLERVFKVTVLMVIMMGLIMAAGFGVVYYGADGARTTLSGSYDPNDLALVIASCSAMSMWALRESSKLWRLLGLIGLSLAAYMISRTYSRGGSIAFGTMILLAVFLARKSLPIWFRLALIPALAGALMLAPADFRDRLATLGSVNEDYNTFAEAGRIAIWKRGVGYFLARPLNGVGIGQFTFAEGKWGADRGFTVGWEWKAAHNMYVESSAELGIPGITGLLMMFVPTVLWSRRLMKRKAITPEQVRLQRAGETLFLSVVAFMLGSMFLSAAMNPMVLLLAAMGTSHRILTSDQAMDAAKSGAPARPRYTGRRSRWKVLGDRGVAAATQPTVNRIGEANAG